jgi:hypothetical protein
VSENLIKPMCGTTLRRFKDWLTERGAEVLRVTNDYEVIRYRAGGATHVVYRNDHGKAWRAVNGANEAVQAFLTGGSWTAPIQRTKNRPSLSTKMYFALVERDTSACFYCNEHVAEDEATIEHLVARSMGGPNHMANYVLAHARCNQTAGNLSVAEKVRLRDRMRTAA